ncbi:MAG: peptide chain release factor N(5)-glutamine methyltransferase [Firmicutes bacterium]|nr:peptide chain release factor N(5)-glutamine methyltransferase [Bacillota bacterium]
MKTRIMVKNGEYKLSSAGCMDAKIDAEELYCYLMSTDRVGLFLRAEEEVEPAIEKKYNELITTRASRVPLQHITRQQEFMGYKFKVTEDVLVPRQDTETLVTEAARVIQQMPQKKPTFLEKLRGGAERPVLDLCCGSGVIGISLAKICSDIKVYGTDNSEKAVALAAENAKELRAEVTFLCGDLFEPLKDKSGKDLTFDMIVSNPPYIRTNMIAMLQAEVKDHEPREALDGGRDGLDYYRRIVDKAAGYLNPGGWLLFEIGHDQGEELRKLLRDSGKYTPAEVIKDLPGRDRVVKCQKK